LKIAFKTKRPHWEKQGLCLACPSPLRVNRGHEMKILFIITTDDGETIFNAMRLANVGVEKGDEVSVFMLGKGVLFENSGSEQFDVMGQMSKFRGDFYV
jgi:uncharacterized protein involved in oxidation of intracellular sulfur